MINIDEKPLFMRARISLEGDEPGDFYFIVRHRSRVRGEYDGRAWSFTVLPNRFYHRVWYRLRGALERRYPVLVELEARRYREAHKRPVIF